MQKKRLKSKYDPCPICGFDLHYNDKFSRRVALFEDDGNFIAEGWMCPRCESEFDLKDNLTYISDQNFKGGKA